ncbi:hypothetical protein A2U01_0099463, partial [Trifolium medium]|nr:hypothetical protein [Trifolium medium]
GENVAPGAKFGAWSEIQLIRSCHVIKKVSPRAKLPAPGVTPKHVI